MKREHDSNVITVSFQVKKDDWPDLYNWLSSLRRGEASLRIREILTEEARKATSRACPQVTFATPCRYVQAWSAEEGRHQFLNQNPEGIPGNLHQHAVAPLQRCLLARIGDLVAKWARRLNPRPPCATRG